MTTPKKFASQADLEVKKVTFDKLSDNAYAYIADDDAGVRVALGGVCVRVVGELVERDFFDFEISLRGEFFGRGHGVPSLVSNVDAIANSSLSAQ